jgi:ADP-heptose:LPS heptosyltransferase
VPDLFESPCRARSLTAGDLLVIQLARLGDFLQSTPLLAGLKEEYPGESLAVLVTPAQAPLARHCPYVDQVLVCDPAVLTSLAREPEGVGEVRRAVLSSLVAPLWEYPAATVINLNLNRVSAALAAGWPAAHLRGWRYEPDQDALKGEPWSRFVLALAGDRRLTRLHLCDIWLSHAAGSPARLDRLSYAVEAQEDERARNLLPGRDGEPLVALQLGANNDLRRWPVNSFAELAAGLMDQGSRVALVGSDRERPLARRLKKRLGPAGEQVVDLMGLTDLPTLAACLGQADLVVGADTGTLHLATAVGAKVLALYMGPAAAHETGPYGPGHLVLQARDRCGPCREESPVCRGEAPCRWLIKPRAALAAALALLEDADAAGAAAGLDLPPGVEALEGRRDAFGQSYRSLLPRPLTASQAAALALRQAGRVLLRCDYQSDRDDLGRELKEQFLPPLKEDGDALAGLDRAGRKLAAASRNGDLDSARRAVEEEPVLWPLADLLRGDNDPQLARANAAASAALEACRAL